MSARPGLVGRFDPVDADRGRNADTPSLFAGLLAGLALPLPMFSFGRRQLLARAEAAGARVVRIRVVPKHAVCLAFGAFFFAFFVLLGALALSLRARAAVDRGFGEYRDLRCRGDAACDFCAGAPSEQDVDGDVGPNRDLDPAAVAEPSVSARFGAGGPRRFGCAERVNAGR